MRRSMRPRGARRLMRQATAVFAGLAGAFAVGRAVVVDAHADVCHVRALRGHVHRARRARGRQARRARVLAAAGRH